MSTLVRRSFAPLRGAVTLYLVPPESVPPDHIFQVRTEIYGPPGQNIVGQTVKYIAPLEI